MYPIRRRDDDFNPFTGPYLKALEMKAFIDDLKFKREAREQQRQQWQIEMEDRKRNQTMQDFQTRLALANMGAMPAPQGSQLVDEALTNALGPPTPESFKARVDVPFSDKQEGFYLPSQEEKVKRTVDLETAKARAVRGLDEESGRKIRVKVPQFGDNPAQEILVDANQYGETIKQIRDAQQGVKSGSIIGGTTKVDDKTGAITFVGIDAQTRQPIEIPFNTKLSPKDEKEGKPKGLSAGARQALEKAQAAINLAKTRRGKRGDRRTSEQLWEEARIAAEQAAAAYPDELEGGKGEGGFAYIRPIIGDEDRQVSSQPQKRSIKSRSKPRSNDPLGIR